MEKLDRTTLWYDAIQLGDRIVLVCPKLRNFRAFFRKGTLMVDGRSTARPRIRRYRRHDIVAIPGAHGRRIEIEIGGQTYGSPVSPGNHDLFRGLNTAFFISKDNDLAWIGEYIRFHRHFHDLQAVAVIDNNSTAYSKQELSDYLKGTGLAASLVLDAPQKYGPRGKAPFARAEKFLQTAAFNVMRLRYLSQARAVLSSDIDEMLHTDGTSVFDYVVQQWPGFVILPTGMRYPAPGVTGAQPQSAHSYLVNTRHTRGPKWCINPQGPLRRFSWDIHRLEHFPFNRPLERDFGLFWHCNATTTGWKSNRQNKTFENLTEDPVMTRAMSEVFGDR